MSTGKSHREDADLEALLSRRSPVSADYHNLERVEPPTTLDDRVLAAAKVAAKSAPKSAPKPLVAQVAGKPAPTQPAPANGAADASSATAPAPVEQRKRSRPPPPPDTGDDDPDDVAPPSRPPWLLPAALAASVLVAVAVGLAVFMNEPSGTTDSPLDGSLFAKRVRARSEGEKAAAAATTQRDAEVVELELAPLPPPPIFEDEGPQVQDLDAAIVLIRKELLLANNIAASQEEARLGSPDPAVTPAVPSAPAAPSVVQPRERRLSKILELYDGGNPDLAGDSLEIFLRDFEDDPISQRILGVKP